MEKKQKAILCMILSALSLCIMQIAVKASGKTIPIMEQVFMRNFVTLLFGFILLMKNRPHIPLFGKRENQKALFFRSIFGYLGVVMYFYATKNMLAADATILHKSSPFFVTLFSFLFLKEKLTKVHVGVLIGAFVGAVFVIRPQFNSAVFPAVVGLLSAAAAGAAYTIIGFLRGKENNIVIIFYFSFISCLCSLPFMLADFVVPNGFEALMLLLIGVFAGGGQFFLTIAYKNAPAGEVSIYNYSSIIFSCILGFIFLNEMIDLMSFIGIIIILVSALTMYFYDRRKRAAAQQQKG